MPYMSTAEFMDRLAKSRGGFVWSLEGVLIRGYRKDIAYCPITAVVKVVTGEYCSMEEYEKAAARIPLSPRVAEVIADAADNHDVGEGKRRIVRMQLLRVLGLEE